MREGSPQVYHAVQSFRVRLRCSVVAESKVRELRTEEQAAEVESSAASLSAAVGHSNCEDGESGVVSYAHDAAACSRNRAWKCPLQPGSLSLRTAWWNSSRSWMHSHAHIAIIRIINGAGHYLCSKGRTSEPAARSWGVKRRTAHLRLLAPMRHPQLVRD